MIVRKFLLIKISVFFLFDNFIPNLIQTVFTPTCLPQFDMICEFLIIWQCCGRVKSACCVKVFTHGS